MGAHVGFESWLERDNLMLLDFDPAVAAVSSQPFWLFWTARTARPVPHAPDYFARLHDGNALVVDCRPVRTDQAEGRGHLRGHATACEQVGWRYRLVGATDAILTAKRPVAGRYRHPRHDVAPVAAALREACAAPLPLMTAAEAGRRPIAVLPVLFHLLWRHELDTDLSTPLHPDAVITLAVN